MYAADAAMDSTIESMALSLCAALQRWISLTMRSASVGEPPGELMSSRIVLTLGSLQAFSISGFTWSASLRAPVSISPWRLMTATDGTGWLPILPVAVNL